MLFFISGVSLNKDDIQDWGTIKNSCKYDFFQKQKSKGSTSDAHYIRQSLCLTVEELVGTSTLCWNCVVIEVFLDIFLDDNCMLLDLFQSLWICEPCTLSSICQFTRKKIFREFLASRTPHLCWSWYVGWFVDHPHLASGTLAFSTLKKATLGKFEIYPPAPIEFMCWGAPTETYQWELTAAYSALETF